MSKLAINLNVSSLTITPLETIGSIEELNEEIGKSFFTCCKPITDTHQYKVYDKDKNLYLFPDDYVSQLMGNNEVTLNYYNTLYDLIDVNNPIHRQFILDYNGGDDFDRALFLTKGGKVRILSCPEINCDMETNMEVDILNGFVIINGDSYSLTNDWVYEFI